MSIEIVSHFEFAVDLCDLEWWFELGCLFGVVHDSIQISSSPFDGLCLTLSQAALVSVGIESVGLSPPHAAVLLAENGSIDVRVSTSRLQHLDSNTPAHVGKQF